MNNEASRKAFEVWAKSVELDASMGPSDAWGQKQYLPHIQSMWTGWQASRKALQAEQVDCVNLQGIIEMMEKRVAELTAENNPLAQAGNKNTAKQIDLWFVEGLHKANRALCPYADDTLARQWWMRGCNHGIMLSRKQPLSTERASLIRRAETSVAALNSRIMEPFFCALDQNAARTLSDCIDMLEADAKEAFAAGMSCRPASAQQVAVPADKREPLTEREIFDIDPCPHEMFDQQRIAFARAIEAHHGITPQGDKP